MVRVTRHEGVIDFDAVALAQHLLDADEEKRMSEVRTLLFERALSKRVRQLNHLLECPDHRTLGLAALKSIGFDASA